jgi:hypothetical protein
MSVTRNTSLGGLSLMRGDVAGPAGCRGDLLQVTVEPQGDVMALTGARPSPGLVTSRMLRDRWR